jgi:MoaA/NifB/PqqE/SkfB family radical SAM enzyme
MELLRQHANDFKHLRVARVALSGGEALMHSNLWAFCEELHSIGIKISLLSTGITLEHHAKEVVKHCDDVIISLDGNRDTHNEIRNIPLAFERLENGVGAIKSIQQSFRVTGRTVLQKRNFRVFPGIVATARDMGLDQISFLAADVSSMAFNRVQPWETSKISEIALSIPEVNEFETILKSSFKELAKEYDSRFIAESRIKLLELVQYYRALHGDGSFPLKVCNAPWVSAVVESTGEVLPCFFHKSYDNIHRRSFSEIINSAEAVLFRKSLDVQQNPTCQRCVCSLHVGITQSV